MWTASRVCSSRHAALLKRFIQLDACVWQTGSINQHRNVDDESQKKVYIYIPNSKVFQTSFHGQPTGWVEKKQPDPKQPFSARPWSWHGNCCWRSFLSFSPPGIKKRRSLKKKTHLLSHGVGPSKTKVFYNQNKDHLGAIYIYTYIQTHTHRLQYVHVLCMVSLCLVYFQESWTPQPKGHGKLRQWYSCSVLHACCVFHHMFDNIVLRVTCQLNFIHHNASPHAGHRSKWYKWDQISDKLADEKPTKKGFFNHEGPIIPPFRWFNQRWTLLVDVIHIVLGVIRHLPRLGPNCPLFLGGQKPSKTKVFYTQNKGPHLGARYSIHSKTMYCILKKMGKFPSLSIAARWLL